ncbi:MAG: hypothetical protein ACP5IL_13060 [Syntrophobacteraceae bacterium]
MDNLQALVAEILGSYVLPVHGIHGVVHWARVMENGLRVAKLTGAHQDVVVLFALFHDSRRLNESRDDGHGLRGAQLALSLRGTLLSLGDAKFELLFEACKLHTNGLTHGDPTLQACWDADRLDLGRAGIVPEPKRLCTDAARSILDWAYGRAVRNQEPSGVLASWGL